jgi:hypothetical protein
MMVMPPYEMGGMSTHVGTMPHAVKVSDVAMSADMHADVTADVTTDVTAEVSSSVSASSVSSSASEGVRCERHAPEREKCS